MRKVLLACATVVAILSTSQLATALNPQPLPPGAHQPPPPSPTANEPPDPCINVHGKRAHARCVARHHQHTSTLPQADLGAQTPGHP